MSHRPIILGVVGDSAAGKTTITRGIATILGAGQVATLCTDDYHRYTRDQRAALAITPLHPDSNDLELMEQHLRTLAAGEPVRKPVYNHETGEFDPPEEIWPRQFLIVEGLLGFATPRLRDCYHIKVFLDPPEELRHQWKIRRDCTLRGYTPAQVLAEIERRAPDAAEFIYPQRGWADLVVRFYPPAFDTPIDNEHLNVLLTLRPGLPQFDLSDVIASNLGQPVLRQRVGRDDGRLTELLEIDGQLSATQAAAIEESIWAHLPALPRLRPDQIGIFAEGHSHPLAITQLLIVYHLLLAHIGSNAGA